MRSIWPTMHPKCEQCWLHGILKGARSVAPGRRMLTNAERRTLLLIAQGHDVAAVAEITMVSMETVKTQLKTARTRLGARNTTHALALALQSQQFVLPAINIPTLTRRQDDVLGLFAAGLGYGDAAHQLGLSIETVKTHARRARTKVGAANRAHAVAFVLAARLQDGCTSAARLPRGIQ
jgi:DNA-binding CsgD family transcriptional regulator